MIHIWVSFIKLKLLGNYLQPIMLKEKKKNLIRLQEKKEVQLLVAYKMLILHGYISKKTNKKQTQANESTSISTWLLYEVCNLISIMGIYETRKT